MPAAQAAKKASNLDLIGAALSTLCLAHCTLLPLLAAGAAGAMLPAPNEAVESWLIMAVAPLGAFAFARGFRRHANKWVATSGFLALAVLALPRVLGDTLVSESTTEATTRLASLALIVCHLWNHRLCCLSECEESDSCQGG